MINVSGYVTNVGRLAPIMIPFDRQGLTVIVLAVISVWLDLAHPFRDGIVQIQSRKSAEMGPEIGRFIVDINGLDNEWNCIYDLFIIIIS